MHEKHYTEVSEKVQGFVAAKDVSRADRRSAAHIGNCILIEERSHRPKRAPTLAFLRLGDIQKIIAGRCGGPCDTDDGEVFYRAALPWIISASRTKKLPPNSHAWARRWVPELASEHPHDWFEAEEMAAPSSDTFKSGDSVACQLNVTSEEVKAFGLKTFGSIDKPAQVRQRERREKDREYQRRKREANGAIRRGSKPTKEELARSKGVSRSTYYRRERAGLAA